MDDRTLAHPDWSVFRAKRLAPLVLERELLLTGFHPAMRALVAEEIDIENEHHCMREFTPEDELPSFHDILESLLEERFIGMENFLPAAYKIRRDDPDYGVVVEIYEVEASSEINPHKLTQYGIWADVMSPAIELHILDRYDNEIVVDPDALACFWRFTDEPKSRRREMMKHIRRRARAQHHGTVVVDERGTARREREIVRLKQKLGRVQVKSEAWKAAADALRELGITV